MLNYSCAYFFCRLFSLRPELAFSAAFCMYCHVKEKSLKDKDYSIPFWMRHVLYYEVWRSKFECVCTLYRAARGGATVACPDTRFLIGNSRPFQQSLPFLRVGEFVPDLSEKNKALTCSSAGCRKSLNEPNTRSNCLHDIP